MELWWNIAVLPLGVRRLDWIVEKTKENQNNTNEKITTERKTDFRLPSDGMSCFLVFFLSYTNKTYCFLSLSFFFLLEHKILLSFCFFLSVYSWILKRCFFAHLKRKETSAGWRWTTVRRGASFKAFFGIQQLWSVLFLLFDERRLRIFSVKGAVYSKLLHPSWSRSVRDENEWIRRRKALRLRQSREKEKKQRKKKIGADTT